MQHDAFFHWRHKDLLDVDQLTREELFHLLDTAANMHEINERPVKKAPVLKGKSIVLFFAEPSTRTKTSFDMAGKRLSARSPLPSRDRACKRAKACATQPSRSRP